MSSSTMSPVSLLGKLHSENRLEAEVDIRDEFIVIFGRHYYNKDAIITIQDNKEVSSFYTLEELFNLLKKSDCLDMVSLMTQEENSPPLIKRQKLDNMTFCLVVLKDMMALEEKFPLMLLPDELIVHILSYLSQTEIATKVSGVSKRMKMICLDKDLWTRLVLPEEHLLSPERAAAVVTRCNKLKKLDVSRRIDDGEMLALEVFGQFRDLKDRFKKLIVDECSLVLLQAISKSSLTSLHIFNLSHSLTYNMVHLSNLTELFLSGGPDSFNDDHMSNELLAAIGLHCKKLVIFHFGLRSTAEGVTALLQGELSYTIRELSFDCSKHQLLGSISTCPALANCVHMVKLIARLPIDSSASIHDFEAIYRNLHRLEILELEWCSTITADDYINAFSDKKLDNLLNLKLSRCWTLNDEGLGILAQNCTKLTHLSLFENQRITNAGLRAVLTKCRQLEKLELFCVGRSDKVWNYSEAGKPTYTLIRSVTGEAFSGVDTPALKWLNYSLVAFTAKEIKQIKRGRPGLKIYRN